jgi:catechol 2,3-dioxygenase-like lactoylglutathione lyase family enzyme
MKRLHVSVAVNDIDNSVRFYSTLFGADPTVLKTDYAKWMLENPRVNFSISSRSAEKGVDHLGIQVESDSELAEVAGRLAKAGQSIFEQKATTCCYARSNKAWVRDPEGVAWETFHTFGDSTVYGEDRESAGAAGVESGSCCAPTEEKATQASSCSPAETPRTLAELARACH